MKKLPLAGLLASCIWSGGVAAESLIDAAAHTIETSPDVAIVKNQYLSRIEQIGVAKAGYLPTIDLALGYGHEATNSPSTRASRGSSDSVDLKRGEASLTLRQLVYDGSNTVNDVSRTRAEARAQRYQLWNAAENLTLDVADAYMALIHARETSVLAKDNLEAHMEILEGIRKRSEYGLGSASDLSQVKGRLSRAHSNYLATENNVLDAQARYYRVVGKEGTGLEKPAPLDSFIPATYEQALQQAGKAHPTLVTAQHDIDAATAQLKQRDSAFRPDVRFELGGTWNNNLDGTEGYNNDLTAMLRLRYNLFNGFADDHRKQEAYHQLIEASAVRDRAQRQVAEGLSLSWNAYKLLNQQMEYLQSHVEESDRTLTAYKKQFELGRRTLVDLLDAENELFEARRELLLAQRDFTVSQFRVLNGMGELLAILNIDRQGLFSQDENDQIQRLQTQ